MELYALCDQDMLQCRGLTLEAFVERAYHHGATVVQYRAKNASSIEVSDALGRLRHLWDRVLIVNDHIECVSLCDGIHIGQEDLYAIDHDPQRAIALLRTMLHQDQWIGLSTHNAKEIALANTLPLTYIGLGAYRNTSTKEVSTTLKEELDRLASTSRHRVAAIGGVCLEDHFAHVHYRVIGSGLFL